MMYNFYDLGELNENLHFFGEVAKFIDDELPCKLPTKVYLEEIELVSHETDEGEVYWVLEVPIRRN